LPEATIGYTKCNRVFGETAGCLAYAISNLKEFLENEALRTEFRARRYTRLFNIVRGVQLPQRFMNVRPEASTASDCQDLAKYLSDLVGRECVFPQLQKNPDQLAEYAPWDEDLDWLSAKLSRLLPLHDRLTSMSKRYDHGVIYAVEFNLGDVPRMQNLSRSMHHGITYDGHVPPDRIVAKALISSDQMRLDSTTISTASLRRLKEGITGALMSVEEKIAKLKSLEALVDDF
jgi:hypothetical protein